MLAHTPTNPKPRAHPPWSQGLRMSIRPPTHSLVLNSQQTELGLKITILTVEM